MSITEMYTKQKEHKVYRRINHKAVRSLKQCEQVLRSEYHKVVYTVLELSSLTKLNSQMTASIVTVFLVERHINQNNCYGLEIGRRQYASTLYNLEYDRFTY